MNSRVLIGAVCVALLPWAAQAATGFDLGINGDVQIGSNYIDFGQFPGGSPYAAAPGYGTFEVSMVNPGLFASSGVTPGEFGQIQSVSQATGSTTLSAPFMTFDTGGSNLQLWATSLLPGSSGPFFVTNTPNGVILSVNVDGQVRDANTDATVGTFTMTASATFDGQKPMTVFGHLPIEAPFSATLTETPTTTGGGGGGGGIPEPASWALMLLGLGAAGATLRRSRAARGAPVGA